MQTVTLWNVAQFGWTCQAEQEFGITAVSTWTRDDDVLVLVWQGRAEVSAAVMNGEHVPLDQLTERIGLDEEPDDDATLYSRAGQCAGQIDNRLGVELAYLFAAAQAGRVEKARLRNALRNTALAVLSTPTK